MMTAGRKTRNATFALSPPSTTILRSALTFLNETGFYFAGLLVSSTSVCDGYTSFPLSFYNVLVSWLLCLRNQKMKETPTNCSA